MDSSPWKRIDAQHPAAVNAVIYDLYTDWFWIDSNALQDYLRQDFFLSDWFTGHSRVDLFPTNGSHAPCPGAFLGLRLAVLWESDAHGF